MAATTLRREESLGLALALVGHAAVIAWLVWPRAPAPIVLPERMTVTISDDVGLEASAPQQQAPAPDAGPVQGEAPPPPASSPQVQSLAPRPVQVAAPRPAQQAKPTPWPFAKPAPARPAAPTPKPGSKDWDAAFGRGIPDPKANGKAETSPAAVTGQQKTAINQAIWREIRPFWQGKVPQGLTSDKIISYVRFQLSPDGSLAGPPVLVRQEGVDDSNRPQAKRHAEEAIKAIIRAAPFELPSALYSYWKSPPEIKFSKSNSQ